MPITIEQIQTNLDADRRWRERRHADWTSNYELYRNTVITNRLTQRQSVNVPWMKETIRTLLSKAGEAADMDFEDLSNDGRRSILMQAYWEKCAEASKYDLLDVVDKKNVGLQGRSHTRLNVIDGMVRFTVHDCFDVLVDRYALPWDLDSARRITLVGIYRTLSDLEQNPLYSKEAIAALKQFFATKQGLVTAGQNSLVVADRAERMQDMGVPDVQYPMLGETYVELNECQMKVWENGEDVIHVVITANGNQILMDKPLRDILGVNCFTWTTWGDDLEATDYWMDGAGDIVRVPNQIANAYFSQMVETGILRGYGMNFYDATAKEGWTPVGYVPAPWGFYALPGKPKEVLEHIEVPEMQSHMEEMNWMKQMVETATAATATEKGDSEPGQKTLGELQLMAAKADERLKDLPKFARAHAMQLGDKFAQLAEGAARKGLLKSVTLFKKGASGDYYPYSLKPSELRSPKGYKCKATLKTQKEADSLKEIQKLKIMAEQFPANAPLLKILKQRMLSWGDLNPDEKREVMDFEEQMPAMSLAPGQPAPAAQPQPLPANA